MCYILSVKRYKIVRKNIITLKLGKIDKKYLINYFFQKLPNKKNFAKKDLTNFFLFQGVPSDLFSSINR